MLRAAIHNVEQGKDFHEDESIQTLNGFASFIFSTDAEQGRQRFQELASIAETLDDASE
jgi:hypothetical protein